MYFNKSFRFQNTIIVSLCFVSVIQVLFLLADPPSSRLTNSGIYESPSLKHPLDIQAEASEMFQAQAWLSQYPPIQWLQTLNTFLVNLLIP